MLREKCATKSQAGRKIPVWNSNFWSSSPEVISWKGILDIFGKFSEKYRRGNVISINLESFQDIRKNLEIAFFYKACSMSASVSLMEQFLKATVEHVRIAIKRFVYLNSTSSFIKKMSLWQLFFKGFCQYFLNMFLSKIGELQVALSF